MIEEVTIFSGWQFYAILLVLLIVFFLLYRLTIHVNDSYRRGQLAFDNRQHELKLERHRDRQRVMQNTLDELLRTLDHLRSESRTNNLSCEKQRSIESEIKQTIDDLRANLDQQDFDEQCSADGKCIAAQLNSELDLVKSDIDALKTASIARRNDHDSILAILRRRQRVNARKSVKKRAKM